MGRRNHSKKRGTYTKTACVHCRHCKSKCDNNIPCGHCKKHNIECIKPEIKSKSYEYLLNITTPKTRKKSVSNTLPKTRRYPQRKSSKNKTFNKTIPKPTRRYPQRKLVSKTHPKTIIKSELLYDFSLSEEDYNNSIRPTETKMNFFIKQVNYSFDNYATNIPEKMYSYKYNIKLEFISVLYPYHTIHFQLKNNKTDEIIKYNKKKKYAITITQELSFDDIFKIYNYVVKFNTCSSDHNKCDFVLEILLIPNDIVGALLDLNNYNYGVIKLFTSSPFKLYVHKQKPELKNRKRKYEWNDFKENMINPSKKRKL